MKASAASRNHKVGIAAGVVAVVAMSATAGLAATIVGGVTPSVRPTGAPTVSAYPKGDQWLARARRGVSKWQRALTEAMTRGHHPRLTVAACEALLRGEDTAFARRALREARAQLAGALPVAKGAGA